MLINYEKQKAILKQFPHLSDSDIEKIIAGFELLGISPTEQYLNAIEFSKNFNFPSTFKSEEVTYTLSGSASSTNY